MDKDGLIYSGRGYMYRVNVPSVDVRSTVGARDSTLAGFIYGVQNGHSLIDCAKLAAAFGTASVMSEGTVPPTVQNVQRVLQDTSAVKL